MFSNFKSTQMLALATMLSFAEDIERKMREVLKIYEILKMEFRSSLYLPLSAFVISDMVVDSSIVRNQRYIIRCCNCGNGKML